MKKDVLFLCQFFYPETVSSATLPFDTAKAMVKYGLTVDAMCGYPKEYTDDRDVPYKETVDGIGIHRLKYLQFKRNGKIGRLINYLSFTISVLLRLFQLKKYKTVVVYSTPPILPIAAILGNILFKTKIVFVSYDVYPEIATASKTLSESSLIVRIMKVINKALFKRAYKVIALTDEMKSFLLQNRKGLREENIVTIANWAHEELEKDFCEHAIEKAYNEITIAYLGNMGICQDVKTLVDTIKKCDCDKTYKFIFAGHGSKKEDVYDALCENHQVELYGFLKGQDFQNVLKRTTFGVVSLSEGLNGLCAPSKYYSYIKSGIPVIAVVESESYLFKEIVDNNLGFAVSIGDTEELYRQLQLLKEHKEIISNMSANAKKMYFNKYSKEIAMRAYYELLK